ncbi:uncharacterized protein LOC113851037 [Abrus precatorius]|uniref:Uncharacterized protein LOC113851037 n=1 Tax=Abrus precatorius TaxID=3816 RepID=A0A8B8K2T0_ABRPR|nr:uncharacterized protein LOC113851037 [Abrus precatorius]
MNNQMGHPESTQSTTNDSVVEDTPIKNNGWRSFLKCVGSWLTHKDKDEWLKDMRGNLSLVATVISTMTFQFAFNPPGGVRPAKDTGDDIGCKNYEKKMVPCPGEAILAVVFPHEYFQFLLWNTICFIASLSVCLLLVSGLPLNHRFPMWLLSIGMCITITSLALAYLNAVTMVTPDPVWGETSNVHEKMLHVWIGLLGLLGLFLTVRFVVWGVNIFINKSETSTAPKNTSQASVNHL